MNWFDGYFFSILYGLAGKSATGDFLIVFFGKYFFYVCLAVFAYFGWRAWRRRAKSASPEQSEGQRGFEALKVYGIAIIGAIVARFGVAEIIRLFYHRARPFLALSLPHLLNDQAYSFPSGHTIFMFALATAAYYINKKLSFFLFASGLVIGLARVAGGVHYPTDILGGAVLGILTGSSINFIFKLISFRSK